MPDTETGFRFSYSVQKTEDKGLGVFAGEPIKKGSVVWRHSPGVFVVYDEPSFLAKVEGMASADVIYELTHVHAFEEFPGCLIRALDDGILINHSSQPNLATNKSGPARVSLDVRSPRYLDEVAAALHDDRYSLVATRDIETGEELANDYAADDDGPAFYDVLYEQYDIRDDYLDDG
ncbi:MAG: SET domain-containing protein-lysine N-methyltransferase [Pseudomonadota bacterium]